MRALLLIPAVIVFGASTGCSDSSVAEQPTAVTAEVISGHSVSGIQWGPVPSVLPPGAQIAVLQGNPFGTGVYTLRLKMPPGYTIPPHFHPTDEMATVISGNLLLGHGDVINEKETKLLHAGGFLTAVAGEHHYVIARGATIVQVHGEGPFAITYVNPQ
ncbi:MAG TPA: cupin domain-containing protein [Gemmatimonadaceae bacterium]|nr:cupin domain-containing protein [Gemmatimonadaceae bacterium]